VDTDPLFDLTIELNRLTLAKETPEGGRADVEGRMTREEIEAAAARHGVSLLFFPGADQWCPTVGGYWRAIAAAVGDDIEVQNEQAAILLEDCDSSNMLWNFRLYRRDMSLFEVDLAELARQDKLAAVEVTPGPRERPSVLAD
jgi:hypothetical protein